jgi:hypothetical protein
MAAPYDILGVQTFHGLLYGRLAQLTSAASWPP